MRKIIFLCLGLIALQVSAQTNDIQIKYANEIKAQDLKTHLEIIAGDDYQGRETGSPGQKKAEQYLVNYFKELGLPGGNKGDYTQKFNVVTYQPDAKISLSNSKESSEYYFLKDGFYFYDKYKNDIVDKELVFVGYGIDEPDYSDYEGIDVKGKVVIYLEDEPFDKNNNLLLTGTTKRSKWSYNWRKKLFTAKEHGAIGALSIVADYENKKEIVADFLSSPRMSLENNKEEVEVTEIPVLFVSETLANAILKGNKSSVKKYKKQAKKKQSPQGFNTKTKIEIDFLPKGDVLESSNVLAFMEGSDKKEEVLVITAHYDHIGFNGESIYNGADDDGSGTVSLLELAQAFKKAKEEGNGPRRSILFMAVSGEEKGLLGSEFYSEHPIFPIAKTVADLNIDMIGRHDSLHDNSNYVYLIGSNRLSTELHEISEKANKSYTNLDLDYKYNAEDDPNEFYYRSDHYNFARKGVPVIFYFSGVHEDYHQTTDTVEKIEFEKMSTIVKLVFHTAWELANRDEKIKVDKPIEWD